MRLLTIAFKTSAEFLSHYSEKHALGALFVRTRTDLDREERVLMEISFSGLPNRALVRGTVYAIEPGKGAWLTFDKADESTRDFLLGLARQEIQVTQKLERSHNRFPARLPVDLKVEEEAEGASPGSQTHNTVEALVTEDLGAGGTFIRSDSPPEIGTKVQLVIGPTSDDDHESFTLDGEVAWIRKSGDTTEGFGVRFARNSGGESKRLRVLLRRASESGVAGFIGDEEGDADDADDE